MGARGTGWVSLSFGDKEGSTSVCVCGGGSDPSSLPRALFGLLLRRDASPRGGGGGTALLDHNAGLLGIHPKRRDGEMATVPVPPPTGPQRPGPGWAAAQALQLAGPSGPQMTYSHRGGGGEAAPAPPRLSPCPAGPVKPLNGERRRRSSSRRQTFNRGGATRRPGGRGMSAPKGLASGGKGGREGAHLRSPRRPNTPRKKSERLIPKAKAPPP